MGFELLDPYTLIPILVSSHWVSLKSHVPQKLARTVWKAVGSKLLTLT